MKKLSPLFLTLTFYFLLGICPLIGQEDLKQYILHLIDGSSLRATVLEETGTHTRIKIISGDELLLDNHLITSMEKDNNNYLLSEGGYMIQDSGRYNLISFGLLFGQGASSSDGLIISASVFNYTHGFQFNQYAALGAGFGFDLYDKGYLPVFADFRGYLSNKEYSTFYSLQAGYSFALDLNSDDGETYHGGLLLYPAIGVRLAKPRRKSNILLELGYRIQWAEREVDWRNEVDEIIYRRISLRIGVLF